MGYIKKVVDTGVEFADSYKMPEYVAKARESSKLIDDASLKIATLYCEKGSPLLDMVDELTAAKINTALDIANTKVEQAQKLKTVATGKVIEKKTEAIEMAKLTKASLTTKTIQAKQEGIAKYTALKIDVSKKVDETKSVMRKRAIHAKEEAVHFGQGLEKKLKEKAEKNEYADKVASVYFKAKEQVMVYGEALVKKSLSLPLTLQERMDRGLSYATEEVQIGTMKFKENYAILAEKATAEFTVFKSVAVTKLNVIEMHFGRVSAKAKVALNEKFRTVFGADAATKAEDLLKNLKEANGDVAAKMKDMYAVSLKKVGTFAKTAEKMEEQYLGTTLVFRARARFAGK
jgi:hypothetical protein